MKHGRRLDVAIGLFLLLLPLLWFAPQALGNKTLLPADNLFAFAPWSSYADQLGVGVPQNPLISDLVLENYPWKSLLREALGSGQLPLWNPRLFAGVPFLAAGQHSGLYPLSALFYVLPLWRAYGVFTWLQLGIAALGVYVLARVLRMSRPAATFAGIAFTFSGFYIVSVNFTMIIAAAAWLPYILAIIELMVRGAEERYGGERLGAVPQPVGRSHLRTPALGVAGAIVLGIQILAGHVEITYYVLLVSAFFAVWRLAGAWRSLRLAASSGISGARPANGAQGFLPRPLLQLAGWLAVMVILGLALGAVQLAPLYELVSESFREGSASLAQVQAWAWPVRQIVTFILPDIFGNPTHHSYFDIWTRTWTKVTVNAYGQPLKDITGGAIDWGVKNYVEGANYLGILTLLLAAVAAWTALRSRMQARRARHVRIFAVLAVFSLFFAFGTPLYAALFYLLPGYRQLHSAFRWVYPYTLSMALLAGFGLDYLLVEGLPAARRAAHGAARALGGIALAGGVLSLLVVGASLFVRAPFLRIGQAILNYANLARERGFADAGMAWSYEAAGLFRFGVVAACAGVLLLLTARRRLNIGDCPQGAFGSRLPPNLQSLISNLLVPAGAIALLIADLWWFGHGFNPAVDPKLLEFKPPVVEWLQGQQNPAQPWRMTSYERPAPGEKKILLPNIGMVYGLEDVRGYDSIIPRQYVTFMQRYQTQGELLYNRIQATYAPVEGDASNSPALDDPLLNLLGVRYVLTTQTIQNPAYRLAYDGEVKVYENTRALPRAFIVPAAVPAASQGAALDQLRQIDLRQTVLVEGVEGAAPAPGSAQVAEARISRSTLKETYVDVNISDRGWLVLTDNFFPGWKAYIRPFGARGEGVDSGGQSVEQQVPLYRADGTFRAIYLDSPGQWTVRFVYSPRSFLLGGYTTFLALITLFLIAGWWAWGRYYRGDRNEVATVAKNSAVQMFMSLLNRGIDFAFAMLRLRILNPAGEGSYTLAINFYLILETVTRFGLGTLLMRDVAAERDQARRYLSNVVSLRIGLWLASLPVVLLLGLYYHLRGRLSPEEAQAIAIFVAALFFANIADAITSVFNAYEKMEYPAGLATATTVGKVALGGLVLLPPFDMGFVGLAWVSLLTNVVQVAWLYVTLERQVLPHPQPFSQGVRGETALSLRDRARMRAWGLDFRLQRRMLGESGPLMINNLLATIFWRVAVWLLYDFSGSVAVGIFSAGVKYLDGLQVIPAYFTLAIFPLMSRYARAGSDGIARAYRLAVQFLFIVALPIAVFVTFAATPLIRILGGAAYLPASATALAIMIWYMPIGFVNSVTQYALIAVGQQRFLTRAFVIGVAFTALANWLLVPRFGYLAAAAIMLPAELSLFIPFAWAVHRYVTPVSWPGLFGAPLLAAALDAGAVYGLGRLGAPLMAGLAAGFVLYTLALLLAGTFRNPDFMVLWDRIGGRFKLGHPKVTGT